MKYWLLIIILLSGIMLALLAYGSKSKTGNRINEDEVRIRDANLKLELVTKTDLAN